MAWIISSSQSMAKALSVIMGVKKFTKLRAYMAEASVAIRLGVFRWPTMVTP